MFRERRVVQVGRIVQLVGLGACPPTPRQLSGTFDFAKQELVCAFCVLQKPPALRFAKYFALATSKHKF